MSIWGYRVIALIIIVTFGSLGSFVYLQNRRSRLHRECFLFSLFVVLWTLGFLLTMFANFGHTWALFFSRLSHAFGVIIPIAFLKFGLSLIGMEGKKNKLLKVNYALTALLSVSFLTIPWFIEDVQPKLNFPYYPVAGPLYFVFIGYWLSLAAYTHYLLFLEYRQNQGHRRQQIKYFFLGQIIGWGGAFLLFPLIFGIKIDPVAYALLPVYSILTTYAIVRHQLMDIEVIIRRTAVFAGLFAFVYGVFTTVTVVGQEFFKSYLGWNQWISMIPTVVIITFTLRPLENFLTIATEKFLFQKKFNYRDLLRTFTNEVLTVLDLQKLTERTVIDLVKIIKLESASMLLLDKDAKLYRIASAVGIKDKSCVFGESDVVINYLKQSHQAILKDKAADSMEGHSHLKEDFKKLNAQLCIPISLHDEMTGVLCLGMKKSGEEFTPEDIDILMTLARTLAIALANAQLFDQLSKTQAEAAQREKMAVIGTLAAGINHEICNPLGIVRGQCEMFLLNLRDGIYNSKSREEICQIATDIMNKVIKETDRATGITKRLSGFAKPAKKSESEEVIVEKEVEEVIGLIGHDLKLSNISFSKTFAADFPPIFADKRQIQEVLFNIIRNAAQAMDKKDGKIELSGTSANGIAIIKISDNGSGIPPDKLGQIFNPFFTTKEPGKGTGLGLFIVKQVIERNKGTIAVDSIEGTGTTFTLSFPTAQPATLAA